MKQKAENEKLLFCIYGREWCTSRMLLTAALKSRTKMVYSVIKKMAFRVAYPIWSLFLRIFFTKTHHFADFLQKKFAD